MIVYNYYPADIIKRILEFRILRAFKYFGGFSYDYLSSIVVLLFNKY